MSMTCNGCRVLKKGCSESCILRPCLHWINTAESQANATVFLAKFYGRAGLMNLISNGPEHLRPALFKSLLYEACGRILNPIDGLLGLLLSGNWAVCQAGVESILLGTFAAVTWVNSDSGIVVMDDPELQRSVNPRGRFKRLPDSKPRGKERKLVPAFSNRMDSSSKSDDLGNITYALHNGRFNDKYIEKYSTILSRQEQHKFVSAHQTQTEYGDDLGNFKTSQTDAEVPCNYEVGLELTLGSQG